VERVVLGALVPRPQDGFAAYICTCGDRFWHRLRSRNGCEATAGLSTRSTFAFTILIIPFYSRCSRAN
jgi:hypothetical protein